MIGGIVLQAMIEASVVRCCLVIEPKDKDGVRRDSDINTVAESKSTLSSS